MSWRSSGSTLPRAVPPRPRPKPSGRNRALDLPKAYPASAGLLGRLLRLPLLFGPVQLQVCQPVDLLERDHGCDRLYAEAAAQLEWLALVHRRPALQVLVEPVQKEAEQIGIGGRNHDELISTEAAHEGLHADRSL